MELLPDPLNPVNQRVQPRCPRRDSRSSREIRPSHRVTFVEMDLTPIVLSGDTNDPVQLEHLEHLQDAFLQILQDEKRAPFLQRF